MTFHKLGRRTAILGLMGSVALLTSGCLGAIEDPNKQWSPTPNIDADAISLDGAVTDNGTTWDTAKDTGPGWDTTDSAADTVIDAAPDAAGPDIADTFDTEDGGAEIDGGPVCSDDLTYFEDQIWSPIMAVDCANCHSPTGLAQTTRLIFTDGDSMQDRFETVRVLAEDITQGEALLLLKPTMQVIHGGFQRFTVGSEPYNAFSELVHRYSNPGSCNDIPDPTVACANIGGISPGEAPLRRLTSEQLANTVGDLFWPQIAMGGSVPMTDPEKGYRSYANKNTASQTFVDGLFDAAEFIAAQAVETPSALVGCASSSGDISTACTNQFIDEFGAKAFRRPLTPQETTLFQSLMPLAADQTAATVLGMVIEAMLQSPQFLYLDMTGTNTVNGQADVQELAHHAIASRLSYLLWNTMPDQELLNAAAAGQLQDPAVLTAQVQRLMADPRGRRGVLAFHQDWMRMGRLENTKDAALFPQYNAALAEALREEVSHFVEYIVFDADGRFNTLMTSTTSFVNAPLDTLYGTASGSSGPSDWQQVALPADRKGLLTRAAFLAAHASGKGSSPIQRGVFVMERMFCQNLTPPPNAETNIAEPLAGETIKDVVAAHRADPECASCHDQIDPIGFAFENFDAIGAHRDFYGSGEPVDASGFLTNPQGEFTDSDGLIDLLVNSDVVRNCYATQMFRYAVGRSNSEDDICGLTDVHARFAQTDGDIHDLIVAIVLSDAFRYRIHIDQQQVTP